MYVNICVCGQNGKVEKLWESFEFSRLLNIFLGICWRILEILLDSVKMVDGGGFALATPYQIKV